MWFKFLQSLQGLGEGPCQKYTKKIFLNFFFCFYCCICKLFNSCNKYRTFFPSVKKVFRKSKKNSVTITVVTSKPALWFFLSFSSSAECFLKRLATVDSIFLNFMYKVTNMRQSQQVEGGIITSVKADI